MGQAVLVTGTSTGIGYAIAKDLSLAGLKVYAGVRTQKDWDRLQAEGCHPILLDVCNSQQIQEAKKKLEDENVELFGLVNNAGVALAGPVEGVPMQELRLQMDVNFFGLYEVTQTFLPLLRKSSGRIVNIGSIAGKVTPALFTPYSCSKFAVEAFSDGLRRELRDLGVKVSLIEPGSVKTPIWEKSKATNEKLLEKIPQEVQQVYSSQIDSLRKSVQHAEATAVECSAVTKAVRHAMTASCPKTRYVVGREARMASIFSRVLPDSVLDRLVKVV